MRIQHNIMAMNAYRNYNNNTSALSKNPVTTPPVWPFPRRCALRSPV